MHTFALIKLSLTPNGQGCEIIGKSSDVVSDQSAFFVKYVLNTILEIIALNQ